MDTKPVTFTVRTQCPPQYAEMFNKWYDETHVPLLMKFKGIKRAARYQRISENGEHLEFLATYEFESEPVFKEFWDSPERAVALEERLATWKDKPFEIKAMVTYKLLKSWAR